MESICYHQLPINDYWIYGNAPIDEAEFVGIVENHDNEINQQKNSEMRNGICNGRLTLVETTPIGEVVDRATHSMTHGFTKEGDIEGWDLPGLREKINALNERATRIENLEKSLRENFQTPNWKNSFLPNGDFVSLLAFAPKMTRQIEESLLLDIGSKDLPKAVFEEKINILTQSIQIKTERKCIKLCASTFSERQTYFKKAIDNGINSHGKVIGLCGAQHLIAEPSTEKFFPEEIAGIEQIQNYLSTKKYAIIVFKGLSLPVPHQPELWGKYAAINEKFNQRAAGSQVLIERNHEKPSCPITVKINTKQQQPPFHAITSVTGDPSSNDRSAFDFVCCPEIDLYQK